MALARVSNGWQIDLRAYAGRVTTASQARELAWGLLAEAMPQRWLHVQGVARRAHFLTGTLALSSDVLTAAAWLHDIGYARDVATTGFHPLDGARYLAGHGVPERVANLVARHSNAILEAELRGLGLQMAAFPDEASPLRDALWYCDLTTSPDGKPGGLPTALRRSGAVRAKPHRDPVHH